MFGFDLAIIIPVFIVLYALAALAVVAYGAHRKNDIVPLIVPDKHDKSEYVLRFTKEQRNARDFWECVEVFSFVWPVELVVGGVWGVYRSIKGGIRYFINQFSSRSRVVAERKILAKLEEERDRLLALPTRNEAALANLERMIETSTIPQVRT